MTTLPEALLTRLAATRSLVAATRRLMRAVATTDVTPDRLAHAERTLSELTAELESSVRPGPLRTDVDRRTFLTATADAPWESFGFNPAGIPLELWWVEGDLHGRMRVEPHHEGPAGRLHGGFSAAVMDALLSALVAAKGHRALTGSLDTRFRRSVPVGTTVDLHARLVTVSGRKITAEGWIEYDGERCVEARGLFIDIAGTSPATVAPTAEGEPDGHA
ncbi:PaaI family thioesterase [Nocardioides sp.]|uniref:PaaI family thioesterase n=1 Tax=Nocardioides sp. TaxID=35761 RepID=UPI00261E877E|nr:PaaI family thioesterase [Nocardioides sp.]